MEQTAQVHDIKQLKLPYTVPTVHSLYGMASEAQYRDMIVLLWFIIMHYSSLFQYFLL